MKISRLWGVCLSAALAVSAGGVGVANAGDLSNPTDHTLRIVHLGDSYSAGNGTQHGNNHYEDDNRGKYFRSSLNWGTQVADWLRGQGVRVEYKNLARSGAVSDNPGKIFGKDTSDVLNDEISELPENVDVVFLTIGGNDVEFGTIVEKCFAVGRRNLQDCKNAIEKADGVQKRNGKEVKPRALTEVKDKTLEVFDKLEKSNKLRKNSRVVLLSYPLLAMAKSNYELCRIVRTDKFFVWAKRCYLAADKVRDLGKHAISVQRSLVKKWNEQNHSFKVDYVDSVPDAFAGHEPDPHATARNKFRWINEFLETAGVTYDTGTDSSISFTPEEWYHPNVTGHKKMAEEVIKNFGNELKEMGKAKNGKAAKLGDVDIAFVVDTTNSMWDDIDSVKKNINDITETLKKRARSYRMSLVTYKHFPEEHSKNYLSRLDQSFTSDADKIKAALSKLEISGGSFIGDASVYSGAMEAMRQQWRHGVKKVVLVLGDGQPIDPEKHASETYTAQSVADFAIALDPAEVYAIDSGNLVDSKMQDLVNRTDGKVFKAHSNKDVPGLVSKALGVSLSKPSAWLSGSISGTVNQLVEFDALGSYSKDSPIAKYEWDFDGDGKYDQTTTESRTSHVFAEPISGFGVVRITTQDGSTALSSTPVNISAAPDPKLQAEVEKKIQDALLEERKKGIFELTDEDAKVAMENTDLATGELKSPVKLKGDYSIPSDGKNPGTPGTSGSTGSSGGGGGSFSPSGGDSGSSGNPGKVLSGKDRYETAVKASRYAFPNGAQSVYLASGEVFPDALAAGSVAGKNRAPVLLTRGEAFPETVKTELKRLNPTNITLVGGTARLQPGLESALKSLLPKAQIQRVSGANRYETAVKLAATLGGITQVTIASGENYPDALAAGGVSPAVLLTQQGALPTSTATALHPGVKVTVAGGDKAVTPAVFAQIESIVGKGNVTRVGGKNRFDTATMLAKALRPNPQVALVAVGNNFPDALVGGAVAQNKNGVVVLSNTGCVPKTSSGYLSAIGTKVYLGGKTYTGTTTCQ
ncbi:cell wall-binding repeat-containing protein [Mobiluncus mulieris]|uniref:cell wall-binding repeat-containing protein n=1 Tax=Mobiluncus mulieris TaxID=2052 RepID=UPI00147031C1|nr:cell wall-binding repeat-containing protein [Mobiluncus mulieris]NMX00894.1 VWA domain-containing protein [Mobiluncus mulieris]NMX18692.1 VWA domain-containing protein [Mobiluncus mulieris]